MHGSRSEGKIRNPRTTFEMQKKRLEVDEVLKLRNPVEQLQRQGKISVKFKPKQMNDRSKSHQEMRATSLQKKIFEDNVQKYLKQWLEVDWLVYPSWFSAEFEGQKRYQYQTKRSMQTYHDKLGSEGSNLPQEIEVRRGVEVLRNLA